MGLAFSRTNVRELRPFTTAAHGAPLPGARWRGSDRPACAGGGGTSDAWPPCLGTQQSADEVSSSVASAGQLCTQQLCPRSHQPQRPPTPRTLTQPAAAGPTPPGQRGPRWVLCSPCPQAARYSRHPTHSTMTSAQTRLPRCTRREVRIHLRRAGVALRGLLRCWERVSHRPCHLRGRAAGPNIGPYGFRHMASQTQGSMRQHVRSLGPRAVPHSGQWRAVLPKRSLSADTRAVLLCGVLLCSVHALEGKLKRI